MPITLFKKKLTGINRIISLDGTDTTIHFWPEWLHHFLSNLDVQQDLLTSTRVNQQVLTCLVEAWSLIHSFLWIAFKPSLDSREEECNCSNYSTIVMQNKSYRRYLTFCKHSKGWCLNVSLTFLISEDSVS